MALPKIQTPVFEIIIPSLNKPVDFRPFLVKEEKLLLMAQQSNNDRDIIKAIKQIINNCMINDDIAIDLLTMTDIEIIFLKLRSRSVNNIVDITYIDPEDSKEYNFKIDLEDVKVIKEKDLSNNIKLSDDIGIIMRHPTASIIDEMGDYEDEIAILNFFIKKCIVEIYDEENVYPINEHTDEEIQTFIDNIDVNSFDKIREYIDSAPKLNYVIKYTNSLGVDKEIMLDTLRDFFILR
jgi:hypothetical protein